MGAAAAGTDDHHGASDATHAATAAVRKPGLGNRLGQPTPKRQLRA